MYLAVGEARFFFYLTNLDPHARGDKPVSAIEELDALNSASDGTRCVGLAVMTEELLSACALPLRGILYATVGMDRDLARWIRTFFTDKATRQKMGEALRQQAVAAASALELDDEDRTRHALHSAANALSPPQLPSAA